MEISFAVHGHVPRSQEPATTWSFSTSTFVPLTFANWREQFGSVRRSRLGGRGTQQTNWQLRDVPFQGP